MKIDKMVTPNTDIKRSWIATVLLMTIMFSGCTLQGVDRSANGEITEADFAAASQILGESLSDENAGIMSSLNDAMATISETGFVRSTSRKSGSPTLQDDDDKSGRGRESNFKYSYDPDTGTHTLSFERKVYDDNSYSKSVIDTLKYVYTDINGNFVEHPDQQKDVIETTDFKGSRQGTITSLSKNSFFIRQDTFLINGVSNETALLSIDGKHYGEGNLEKKNENGETLERSYRLQINFLNINIDKGLVNFNQSLEWGVTGTLSWKMIVEKSSNGSTDTKTIRGTIEMNGDGTALLRFNNFKKLFQINLDNGGIKDQDEEFEGLIKSVNIDHKTFTLTNGRIVRIIKSTNIDPSGDITSLEDVAHALEMETNVWAEGEGYIDGEIFVATEVEFETDEDEEEDRQEFENILSGVNLDTRMITLEDSTVIYISEETDIHESGDLTSLEAVREAYELDKIILTYGRAIFSDEEGVDLTATEIRFDYHNN